MAVHVCWGEVLVGKCQVNALIGISYEVGEVVLISGFCRNVNEICCLLGYYMASCGNCLPTFRGNIWVPSSRVLDS
jgi:hypothetical protein